MCRSFLPGFPHVHPHIVLCSNQCIPLCAGAFVFCRKLPLTVKNPIILVGKFCHIRQTFIGQIIKKCLRCTVPINVLPMFGKICFIEPGITVSAESLYMVFSCDCACKMTLAEISRLRIVAISFSKSGIFPTFANSSIRQRT